MSAAKWICAASMLLVTALPVVAAEGSGLTPSPESAPWSQRWQGRLSVSVQPATLRAGNGHDGSGLQITGMSVMGDYYFTRALPLLATEGSFRATSGLIVGGRASAWGGAAPASGLSLDRRPAGPGLAPRGAESGGDASTLPYLGVGYSGQSTTRAWNFSADLGLVALAAGNAVKLGQVFNGGPALDDVVRAMRVAPVVQLGVSYSF